MDVNFACPLCGKRLTLDKKWIGREAQCPFCNSVFLFNGEMVERTAPRQALPVGMQQPSYLHSQPPRSTSTIEARPIGFWARVAAAFIDAFATAFFTLGVSLVPLMVVVAIGGDAEFFGRLIGPVLPWLYYALMESSNSQATLGKLVIGAKVVDANGGKISFGRATGRYFAKYLSTFIFLIGYIMVAFDKRKRGLHDMIAGTYVISRY